MEPPIRPNDSDCCGSGCDPCIFDVYEKQLKIYEASKNNGALASAPSKNCLSLTSYTEFSLIDRKPHTNSTFLFTFCYETNNPDANLSYRPGQHFLLLGETRKFTRAYTPMSAQPERCTFTTLIKLYDDGIMSNYLKRLQIHSKTLWRGPYGDYVLNFNYKYILGIAQGTGIAPIYAVFSVMVGNEDCETFLKLFCCYRDWDDILLRDELYALASNWNFTYDVFLSSSRDGLMNRAKYNEALHTRRLCAGDMERYLAGKDITKTQILICGSKKFSEYWLDFAKGCNIGKENLYVF